MYLLTFLGKKRKTGALFGMVPDNPLKRGRADWLGDEKSSRPTHRASHAFETHQNEEVLHEYG